MLMPRTSFLAFGIGHFYLVWGWNVFKILCPWPENFLGYDQFTQPHTQKFIFRGPWLRLSWVMVNNRKILCLLFIINVKPAGPLGLKGTEPARQTSKPGSNPSWDAMVHPV